MSDEKQVDFDDALARVYGLVEKATKDASNPHFRSKYTTLASIHDACSKALVTEGFSWPQLVTTSKEGGLHLVHVTTQLRRKGLLLESTLALPVGGKGTAQDIGSAITYARRYGLSAIVGVCPAEDDDGNAASSPRVPRDRERDHVDGSIDHVDPDARRHELDRIFRASVKSRETYEEACEIAGIEPKPKGKRHPMGELERLVEAVKTMRGAA